MNIFTYSKPAVLAALFNNAMADQGILLRGPSYPLKISIEDAAEILKADSTVFVALHGKLLLLDLTTDEVDLQRYNRIHGYLAGEKALAGLNSQK